MTQNVSTTHCLIYGQHKMLVTLKQLAPVKVCQDEQSIIKPCSDSLPINGDVNTFWVYKRLIHQLAHLLWLNQWKLVML